jgi:hypothetical protein
VRSRQRSVEEAFVMSARYSSSLSLRGSLIALLATSLLLSACGEDASTGEEVKDSPAPSTGAGDDEDDDGAAPDDEAEAPSAGSDTRRSDAGRGRLDAGGKRDAGTSPSVVDAGVAPAPDEDSGASKLVDASTEPAPATPDTDASTDRADAGAAPAEGREDLGKGDGKDVITIGDSWMNLVGSSGIQQSLLQASGQKYRTYGVPGVELLADNLFGRAVPTQYEAAKKADADIKTVVMTGGGNDILMGSGGAMATIDKVAVRLSALWEQMHDDGVLDVVYIQYSRGGSNKANVEYGTSKVKPACAAARVRCHYIDSDEFIMMQLRDGIHPTDAGYTALGKAVFALMQSEGMRR